MGQPSEWWRNELLKLSFNRDTYTPAYDQFLVCLVTQVPTLNADPASLSEPVGNAYARVAVPFNTANWTVTGYGEVVNVSAVLFPAATGFWGSIEGYTVVTNLAAGGYTPLTVGIGRFTLPLKVTTGIQPRLPAGSLTFGIYEGA